MAAAVKTTEKAPVAAEAMRRTTYIQAINEALREEMRRDPNVFLLGEDIAHYGGLFRVTRNLLDEFGPKRVIDTPISEQGFVGMALGAAAAGMRPVVELMYMDFTLVTADQIFNQIAKYHYMTGGQIHLPWSSGASRGAASATAPSTASPWRPSTPTSQASGWWSRPHPTMPRAS